MMDELEKRERAVGKERSQEEAARAKLKVWKEMKNWGGCSGIAPAGAMHFCCWKVGVQGPEPGDAGGVQKSPHMAGVVVPCTDPV